MATIASYTSMSDVSANVASQAEYLFQRIYNLDDSIDNWGLRESHFETLDGIAQNIINLKLTHYENVRKAREHFNERWENWGIDEYAFEALYNACADSLSQFLHPLNFSNYDQY